MRGSAPGLVTPHPMGDHLPPLFREDDLAQRFTGALDDVLAPLLLTLDNLPAYLDPTLAPADFVGWLAGWVGLSLDANWPLPRQRDLVGSAADLHRWRGTCRGLAAQVELYTGVEPDIEDSGGVAWSPTPGGELPGSDEASVTVRVRSSDPEGIARARLERLVVRSKPAHVRHEIEMVESSAADDGAGVER